MKIVGVDPRTDPLWRTLVEQTESSVFHSPSWIQVLTETYGWEASAYVVLDDEGKPRAGIPFCRIADIMGERIVALPFSDYCDPLVSDIHGWRFLIDRLLPEQCPITVRCLHNSLPLADERFTLVKQAKWHGLELRPELDDLWNGMHDSTHRAIRKAQRGFLLLAIYKEKIVAGDFFLEWKNTLYYKFNASLPADLSHRPNDLLIWEGIQRGKARGHTFLDFGLSDLDQEGLVRYKRKFGTEEKTISFLRHAPNGSPAPLEKELRDLLT